MYQNKVTLSLTSFHNCKMAYNLFNKLLATRLRERWKLVVSIVDVSLQVVLIQTLAVKLHNSWSKLASFLLEFNPSLYCSPPFHPVSYAPIIHHPLGGTLCKYNFVWGLIGGFERTFYPRGGGSLLHPWTKKPGALLKEIRSISSCLKSRIYRLIVWKIAGLPLSSW